MNDETFLNDTWSLYFHDPNDNDWSIQSYKYLCDITTVEYFCIIFHNFKDLWQKGMFFIMRDYITPRWEDQNNLNGGCFSIKVYPNDLEKMWFNLSASILGETLGVNSLHSLNINGISISPKKNYHIIRIWCKDDTITKREYYNIQINKRSPILYKKHNE